MKTEFCRNCRRRRGYKRAWGIGTLVMTVLTGGLWLLLMPFYPPRCVVCGTAGVSPSFWTASWP